MKKKKVVRKVVRALLVMLGVFFGGILILLTVLLVSSPGRVRPVEGKDGEPLEGSIAEKSWVNIGGVEQGMFIRGKSTENPVLLFVHGGPGMPEYFLADQQDTGLEEEFTVCYWEQRGGGLSYQRGMDGDSITVEQLVSDTLEVTRYLKERFGQEKIYLMAHSWGTFIGIQAAAQAPELYQAYIGMGQIADTAESERIAYAWMIEQYETSGDDAMIKKLQAYHASDEQSDTALIPYFISMERDNAMHELGVGTMHDMNSVITGIFLPLMKSPVYTLGEKVSIWRAKAFLRSDTELLERLFSTHTADIVPQLQIPAYFLSGTYDMTVNCGLSKAYYKQLDAPVKAFYTFANSAHSPMFEESERFMEIMTQDVLTGGTSLADAA